MPEIKDFQIWAIVLLFILQAYNTWSSARKNHREEEQRRNAPHNTIQADLEAFKARVRTLEADVSALKGNQADTHAGTMVLCEGVQALLEHELHNGNSEQMDDASKAINKWLRQR